MENVPTLEEMHLEMEKFTHRCSFSYYVKVSNLQSRILNTLYTVCAEDEKKMKFPSPESQIRIHDSMVDSYLMDLN